MNRLLAALLGAACGPALAQTHMHMPEGSSDVFLSIAAVDVPRSAGSARRRGHLLPLLSAQWSNGIFLRMNTLGMHLSRDPNLEYGPLLVPSFTRIETWRAGEKVGSRQRFTPEAGGFLNYSPGDGMTLRSSLMYGGSIDGRGARLRLGAAWSMALAEYHHLSFDTTATWVNRSALQAEFGVPPWFARASGLPVYQVEGGLRDVSFNTTLGWQASNKVTLSAIVGLSRLYGATARSPRVDQRNGVSVITALTYRF